MERISNRFEIGAGLALNVHATGLYDGEEIVVQYALDLGCKPKDAEFSDYYENGKLVVLDITHNPLTLWRPGWYRLSVDPSINDSVKIALSKTFRVNTAALINNVA